MEGRMDGHWGLILGHKMFPLMVHQWGEKEFQDMFLSIGAREHNVWQKQCNLACLGIFYAGVMICHKKSVNI